MKKLLLLVMALVIGSWAVPKPMESIENYNIMLLHGAYGEEKGWKNRTDESRTAEAYYATEPLDFGAALGRYDEAYNDDDPRLLRWLTRTILEEPEMENKVDYPRTSHIYQWRSFSNPANSSYNNAFELGDRTWMYKEKSIYKHRRTMMEEAQEVKARFVNDSGKVSYGQEALDSIRQNPDLYHRLASRYILVGHSMGGVVSREYVQGNFYNGDVDKIIFKKFCIGA